MEPIKKIKDRGLSIATFKHDNNLSFAVQKSWKKKDSDEFESKTISLFEDDLLRLSELLKRAYNESIELRARKSDDVAQTAAPAPDVDVDYPF